MNRRTREFRAQFDRLPTNIRQIATDKFILFLRDPTHPSLRRHELVDEGRGRQRRGSISVAITMQYRAIYVVEAGVNVWY